MKIPTNPQLEVIASVLSQNKNKPTKEEIQKWFLPQYYKLPDEQLTYFYKWYWSYKSPSTRWRLHGPLLYNYLMNKAPRNRKIK